MMENEIFVGLSNFELAESESSEWQKAEDDWQLAWQQYGHMGWHGKGELKVEEKRRI
jgi:hypothetical protein